jgi:hypothetical protein
MNMKVLFARLISVVVFIFLWDAASFGVENLLGQYLSIDGILHNVIIELGGLAIVIIVIFIALRFKRVSDITDDHLKLK